MKKIEKVELYTSTNGNKSIGTKAELVLIKDLSAKSIKKDSLVYCEATESYKIQSYDIPKYDPSLNAVKLILPIIISHTETIEDRDSILYCNSIKKILIAEKEQLYFTDGSKAYRKDCKKILALHENLSPKTKQQIVNGELKEGEVIVECIKALPALDGTCNEYYLKLSPSNHVTVFQEKEVKLAYKYEEGDKEIMDEVIKERVGDKAFDYLDDEKIDGGYFWVDIERAYIIGLLNRMLNIDELLIEINKTKTQLELLKNWFKAIKKEKTDNLKK